MGDLLINVFVATAAVQDASHLAPQCALDCARAVPNAENQTLVCANTTLQKEVGACVQRLCTIKEVLRPTLKQDQVAENFTASLCRWPHRDESQLCRNTAIVLFVCATGAVVARLASRSPWYDGVLGIDDYVMTFTWTLLIPFTAVWFVMTNNGLGRDMWTLAFDDITLTQEYAQILIYLYILLVWLPKISVLFFYLRLFSDPQLRKVVKLAILLCCMATISFFMGSLLRCQPIDFAWTFWYDETGGKCSDILSSAQGWPHLSVNMFADLAILLLPLPTIWKLHLALEKKLGVTAMFGVGLFVTGINVYRATTFRLLPDSHNITWDWTAVGLWSAIEVYASVICGCMPGIRAFVSQSFHGSKWRIRLKTGRDLSVSGDDAACATVGSDDSAKKNIYVEEEVQLTQITETRSTIRLETIEEERYARWN